ncbi:MAG: hypothetical protein HZB31_09755 [Nitrospirae bacterium]|nr:hypothetical protein [Nitrospirota bacterium]
MKKILVVLALLFIASCGSDSNTKTDTISLYADKNNNGIFNEPEDVTLLQNSRDTQVSLKVVYKAKDGQALQGKSIAFSSDSTEVTFPLGAAVTTDSRGEAFMLVKVTPAVLRNVTTTVSIAAAEGSVKNALLLHLRPVTVSSAASAISATPEDVFVGAQSLITVVAKTNMDTYVPDGTVVFYSSTCGTVTLSSTTLAGVAKATFKAPVVSTDTQCAVTAVIDSVTVGRTTLSVFIASPTNSSITATPAAVVAGSKSVIATYVRGSSGEPVPDGTAVNFSASCGSVSPSSLTSSGAATADFTAPAAVPPAGTCTVTASVSNAPIGSVDITVNSKLDVQPATTSVNMTAGGSALYTITGGFPPYAVLSDNSTYPPSPASVSQSGGTFSAEVPASSVAATVTYTVTDSTGSSILVTMKIE